MLPPLKLIKSKTEEYTLKFLGLNRLDTKGDNEFLEVENLSSDRFPFLSTRASREVISTSISAGQYITKYDTKIVLVDNGSLYFDGTLVGPIGEVKSSAIIDKDIVFFPCKKMYSVDTKQLSDMDLTYSGSITFTKTTMVTTGADFPFKAGDGIILSGCSDSANNKTVVIKTVAGKTMTFGDNTFTEVAAGTITIKREIPNFEYVVEHENRLWGVKGNELFASKLGSYSNFNVFEGLATDSYGASVGTQGPFTGAINYNNNILFFKENCIHKVYGNKPSNYQIVTQDTQGCQMGCEKSIVICNQTLFYKSRQGIVAYNGALPNVISQPIGLEAIYGTNAIAGYEGVKYYITLTYNNEQVLYVFDTEKNIWHKENSATIKGMINLNNSLIALTDQQLIQLTKGKAEEVFSWYAILGEFSETVAKSKGYSSLRFRTFMDDGTVINVSIRCDDGPWKHQTTIEGHVGLIDVLVTPNRCDKFSIKLEGTGSCTIENMVRRFKVRGNI